MKTVCPNCRAPLETPDHQFGATTKCPVCGCSITPDVPAGASGPKTGYEMTFSEFCQLLTDPSDRPGAVPLLREWFGYDVPLVSNGFALVASDGSRVPPLQAHELVQADPGKQDTLYQVAVSLWR